MRFPRPDAIAQPRAPSQIGCRHLFGVCNSRSLILFRVFTPLRNVPKDPGRIYHVCNAKTPGLHRRSRGWWHTELLRQLE